MSTPGPILEYTLEFCFSAMLLAVSSRDFFFNGIINVLTPNRVMLFLYEVDIFVAIAV